MGRQGTGTGAPPAKLQFRPGGTVEALPGETVLNAAWRSGVPLEAPCGGQGICGRCRVRLDNPAPASPEEERFFSPPEISSGWRLACRSPAHGPSRVTFQRSAASVPVRTALPPATGSRPLKPEGIGAAVDLGTTTIALQLWDLSSRRLLATATAPNPQRSFGADVISRISSLSAGTPLEDLADSLRKGVSDLIGKAARSSGTGRAGVSAVVVSGNTVMQHFFMGADPTPLARSPFRAKFLELPEVTARRAGLKVPGDAVVRLVPCASSFVGGDAVAGTVVMSQDGGDVPSLLIDMGTNAEIVLLRKRSVVASSAAAGPALEGGNISCGVSAGTGAVEAADFSGDLSVQVIGGGPPLGVCGSGLLDLVALLLRFGLLMPDGRLLGREEAAASPWHKLQQRLVSIDGSSGFAVTRESAPPIAVSQDDIRQLQLARAAIVTAWKTLLRETRTAAGDVRRVYLAGGYGYSLRRETLLATGLVHEDWADRLVLAGNTSLAGASLMLLDRDLLDEASGIASATRALNLAESPSFEKSFLANLSFPEP